MRVEKLRFVGYVTYTVISPEPEVTAIFNLCLICGHIVAFKRAQVCSNWFNHLRENCADSLSVTGPPTHRHFSISSSWVEWYITLGVSEAPLKPRSLQQFYYLSIEKGKTEICQLRHLYGYISGIGSGRHICFTLALWSYCSFQTSANLSKSVQPSLRKLWA